MANPILSMFGNGAQPQNMAQITPQMQQLVSLYKNGANPMQIIQQNPQLASIAQMARNGGNMQQVFYALCQQKGVNPNDILALFK